MVQDISTYLTIAAIGFTSLALYFHFKACSYWKSRGIDGPTPWPFFGTNIYYVFRNKIDAETDWHEKYGKTFGLYDGYWPTLRTIDNEVIKQVWIKDFSSFTDRFGVFVYGEVAKNWLFFSPGERWANQRALMAPVFTSVRMRSMLTMMKSCTATFKNFIGQQMDQSAAQTKANGTSTNGLKQNGYQNRHFKPNSVLISKDELMSYNLDVTAQSLFGLKLNTYVDKTSEMFQRAFAFSSFDVKRFAVYLLTPAFITRLIKFDLLHYSKFEYFDKLVASILRERRSQKKVEKVAPAKANDFIQYLMDAKLPEKYQRIYTNEDDADDHYLGHQTRQELEQQQEEQTKQAKYFKNFDDLEIRGQTTFLFTAGFETTSASLTFCLYELAHQPHLQQEIYEEIKELVGDRSVSDLDLNELTGLKKLDAFVSETLRLYNPVTENNRMCTKKEGRTVMIEGRPVKLTYQCAVAYNGFLLQRHEDYFEEPLKFDMSRFYPENKHKILPCTYAPFGLGPRNCAGTRFALLNIRLFLANQIYLYTFAPGPKSKQYPPTFNQHAFFLQLTHSDTIVEPRQK